MGSKSAFQEIGDLFRLPGEVKKITLLKSGSTADTYRIDYDTKKKYLFQKVKVSKEEFVSTMDNVEQITSYLKKNSHNLIHLHHTNSAENYIEYHNEFWRVKRYFEEYSHVDTDDLDVLNRLGVSIGNFQYLTRDFDLSKLHNVYPNIHNLPLIINSSADEYVLAKKEKALLVEKAYEEGSLPSRLVHLWTKKEITSTKRVVD